MLESILVIAGVFLIAFMFAPVGMGGGMLFVPLLHYVAEWPIDGTLLAVSLTLTWAVSIGSGLRHRREGFHNDAAIKSALYGALIGALIGVGIVNALGDGLDSVFKLLAIMMLIWALTKTWKKEQTTEPTGTVQGEGSTVMNHLKLRVGGGIGGVISSVLGVGAGVIYVPVLRQQASLGPRTSVGSSLAIMMVVVPVAILALMTTSPNGLMEQLSALPKYVYSLPILAFFGATFGAKVGIERISKENIMRLFMALVAVVLVRYVVDVASIMV